MARGPAKRTLKATVVVPCFNEAARLVPSEWVEFAAGHPTTSFLMVDDGSSDGTADVIRAMAAASPQITALVLPHNQGKAEAVRQGLLSALHRGDTVVGFWDADLATPLVAIPTFMDVLATRPDVGFVLGARVRLLGRAIDRDTARHWFGRGTALAASLVLGLTVYDTQCGAKLLRPGPHADALFARPFSSRWAFDVELLARWIVAVGGPEAASTTLVEVPLDSWVDVAGSKLTPLDFLRTPLELLKIGWSYRVVSPRSKPRRSAPPPPPE